jgi:Arc/MetJ-type ribon-helix-helix transcriptional regulator
MAPSKAISVELKAQQQAMLQRQLESGHYDTVDEIIGDALRALDERDAVYDEAGKGDGLDGQQKADCSGRVRVQAVGSTARAPGEGRQAWRVRLFSATKQTPS